LLLALVFKVCTMGGNPSTASVQCCFLVAVAMPPPPPLSPPRDITNDVVATDDADDADDADPISPLAIRHSALPVSRPADSSAAASEAAAAAAATTEGRVARKRLR